MHILSFSIMNDITEYIHGGTYNSTVLVLYWYLANVINIV